jgi:hypothetical protein
LNKYLTCFLLILTITTNGQTVNLDYITKGPVVKFNFKNLTFYTDTSAIFSINDYYPYVYDDQYMSCIKSLIYSNIRGDTATFTGSFIPFNDGTQKKIESNWRIWLTIRQLIIENKVVMINSKGEVIKKIRIKKKGGKEKCFTGKVFINAETKEEIFMYKFRYVCTGWIWDY